MTQKTAKTKAGRGETGNPTPPTGAGRGIRLKSLDDLRLQMSKVYSDARRGNISVEDAKGLAWILSQMVPVFEATDLVKRIAKLETR